jgi:hypothetical protein
MRDMVDEQVSERFTYGQGIICLSLRAVETAPMLIMFHGRGYIFGRKELRRSNDKGSWGTW